jgi:antagonist of KipI
MAGISGMITIRKAGLLTTIQDKGRMHYLSQAVPASGVMDSLSARIANIALGNDDNCAVIEFTQSGAIFFTDGDLLLAFSGDGAYLRGDEGRLLCDRPIFIPSGTSLYLEHNKSGCRSYLAVAGGWDVRKVLGSRSTYLTAKIGGLDGLCLTENDQLCSTGKLTQATAAIFESLKGPSIKYTNWSVARELFLSAQRNTIRVITGREFDWFTSSSKADFLSHTYNVGHNSNRMGYHLLGAPLHRHQKDELLSTAVTQGTIQVTNDGSLILLMADCQTTGGYPRIGQVAAVDMPLCAQLKPGDTINFKEIGWKEAEKLYIQLEHDLNKLRLAIRQKYALNK